MPHLDQLLDFVRFTHAAHKVERVARIPGTDRSATMVEHSYQLTLLAWFLIDSCKLTLDKDKVIRYALVHDLVETYAGDTYFYDTAGEATKDKREKEAQDRIEREYPQFGDLHETIKEYEKHSDAESRFVYALDKLIDPLTSTLKMVCCGVKRELPWKCSLQRSLTRLPSTR